MSRNDHTEQTPKRPVPNSRRRASATKARSDLLGWIGRMACAELTVAQWAEFTTWQYEHGEACTWPGWAAIIGSRP